MKSDHELMKEFYSCSERAFDELVKRYTTPLTDFVQKYIPCLQDAEDIALEVFIQLHDTKTDKRYEFSGKFRTWLYKITRNRAIDAVRRKKKDQSSYDESIEGLPCSTSPDDPPNKFEKEEKKELIWRFVNKLELRYWEVIWMNYHDELSLSEMSIITRKKIGTLKSLCSRGLDKLYSLIEKEGYKIYDI